MRFLFINQYYSPDYAATAQQLGDLCEALVRQGHEIHVLTGNALYDGRDLTLPPYELLNGVHVHRVGMGKTSRRRIRDRLAGYLVFYFKSLIKLHLIEKPDVVIPLTTPPLISILGAWLKILKGTRYVYWVMDVYPDIAMEAGVLKKLGATRSVWAILARFSYYFADRVIVLGRDMKDTLKHKQVPSGLIEVVRSWADGREIVPIPHGENQFRTRNLAGASFLVEYSGNLGTCHRYSEMVEGVRLLDRYSGIRFVFIGGGKLLPFVREALDGKFANVGFLPYQSREELAESLSAADLHLISLDSKYDGLLVPSKVYGIMASGRPALLVGSRKSEVARLLIEHDCGVVVEEGDAEGFARTVRYLHDHPAEAARMGANGRKAFEEHYDKSVGTRQFGELLETVVNESEGFDQRSSRPESKRALGSVPRFMAARPVLACLALLIVIWAFWQPYGSDGGKWNLLSAAAAKPEDVASLLPGDPAALRRATRALDARMISPPSAAMEALFARRIALDPLDSDAWLGIARRRIFDSRQDEGRSALTFADSLNPAFPRERLRSLQHWVFLGDREKAEEIADRTAALDFAGRLEAADALLSAGFLPEEIFSRLNAKYLTALQTALLLTRVMGTDPQRNEPFFASMTDSFYSDAEARDYLLQRTRAALPYDVACRFWKSAFPHGTFMDFPMGNKSGTLMNPRLETNPKAESSFFGWQVAKGPRSENVVWRRPDSPTGSGSLEFHLPPMSTGASSWVFYRLPLPASKTPITLSVDVDCSPVGGARCLLVGGFDGKFTRGSANSPLASGWQRLETTIPSREKPGTCELILEISRGDKVLHRDVTVRLGAIDAAEVENVIPE